MTDGSQFRLLANSLADFRDRVAKASNVMHDAVDQYVAMMQTLDAGFALHYADMPAKDREKMLTAFAVLAHTVNVWSDDPPSDPNVVRLPEKEAPR